MNDPNENRNYDLHLIHAATKSYETGQYYFGENLYHESLTHFLVAQEKINCATIENDFYYHELSRIHTALAINYELLKDLTKAIDHYEQSLHAIEKIIQKNENDIQNSIEILINLGDLFLEHNPVHYRNSALENYLSAIEMINEIESKNTKDWQNWSYAFSAISNIYYKDSQFNEALKYLLYSFNSFENIPTEDTSRNDLTNWAATLHSLACLYNTQPSTTLRTQICIQLSRFRQHLTFLKADLDAGFEHDINNWLAPLDNIIYASTMPSTANLLIKVQQKTSSPLFSDPETSTSNALLMGLNQQQNQ